ncbi:DeoR/GlpR family DNA-binding transcription regulator [Neotabrizicola sp. VNH66]|uniref:DeoR/GlpR family DNA-binding transcription regulator n=1 Tax=Neotabrizicola sp. VNH66 TaxID=3400918 RepID=UPI003C03CF49
MLSSERERAILQLLEEEGSARIERLAERLRVTGETVRRNVKRLEAQGLVARVHGGVHLKDWGPETSFAQRMLVGPGAKRRVAEAVARMLPDGVSLFLDVGSTTAYVAQALRARRELFVVTNSLPVAQALAGVNGNRVFMAGGELRAHDGGAFGAEALEFIRQFRLSHVVLSATAISAEGGFLLQDLREAEFSRAMIERAETVIVAADSAKFGRSAPITIAPDRAFHHLVTDAAPDAALAARLAQAGVQVTLA